MKKTLFFFTIMMAVLSCNKDEDLPPNNNGVSIKTLSHTINNEGGVTLVGEIKHVEIPIDYGFIISSEKGDTYKSYSLSNSKIITGLHNGRFSIDFTSDLRPGITYYYNTIAFKNGEYIYGKEKSFLSNGSASPQIKSIIPSKAHLGDTIVINGLNFSKNPRVSFNTYLSNALVKNDTLITCIVTNRPNYNTEKLPFLELKVETSTNNEIVYNEFSLHTPRVDSIRPYEVYPGDTLTIYGDHFNRVPSGNRLFLPNIYNSFAYPKVIKANQKELVFVLGGIGQYEPIIQLESQFQTIIVKEKIKTILPTITSVSKNSIKYGEKLVVYGSHFPDQNSYNRDDLNYKFGSGQMPPFETHKDSLVINMSDTSQYEDFIISGLSIHFFGNTINFKENIVLDEDYVRVSFIQDNILCSGTIGKDLYAVAYPHFFTEKYLVKLNKETNRFDQLYPDTPLVKAPSGIYFSFFGTKFYSFETSNSGSLFYSYDIFSNVKKQQASFPGENRNNPFLAVMGNYLYYGLGSDTIRSNGLDDIWRYSFLNDTWEFVLDFPEINSYDKAKVRPLSFIIGTKLYIGGGQPSFKNQLVDFWEFDTNTNIVTKKSDLPITIPLRIDGFSVYGKGFFDMDGKTYMYDPVNNSWAIKRPGMDFSGYNEPLLQTDDIVYSRNNNFIIKIKKEYFNK